MKRIVECVPNFSEGRDLAKIDAIIAAMREVPGVYLLDRESDADHNRSVVTLAGEPEPVAEAALRGRPADAAAFAQAADIVLRDAKGFGHNTFKISLARRAIVRALSQAARGTPQVQSNKKIA